MSSKCFETWRSLDALEWPTLEYVPAVPAVIAAIVSIHYYKEKGIRVK